MRVAVRTIAGKQVGFGHLRRCMTLADALRARGIDVQFWTDLAGDEPAATLAAIAGEKPAAVIADSYQLTEAWFAAVRPQARLLVIDDLADRMLDADLVTNSALGAGELPYHTGAHCRLLLGPSYALVRPAFCDAAHTVRPTVERVLVTLGGSDPQFHTRMVVGMLQTLLPAGVHIDVVIGPLHGEDAPLEALADARTTLHRHVDDLAPLLAATDVAISAGGQTTFELAAAGVPAVAIAVADNQRHVLAGFDRAGTLVLAGDAREGDVAARLQASVARVVGDHALRQRMSEAGRRLVDGKGADRVAAALLEVVGE